MTILVVLAGVRAVPCICEHRGSLQCHYQLLPPLKVCSKGGRCLSVSDWRPQVDQSPEYAIYNLPSRKLAPENPPHVQPVSNSFSAYKTAMFIPEHIVAFLFWCTYSFVDRVPKLVNCFGQPLGATRVSLSYLSFFVKKKSGKQHRQCNVNRRLAHLFCSFVGFVKISNMACLLHVMFLIAHCNCNFSSN